MESKIKKYKLIKIHYKNGKIEYLIQWRKKTILNYLFNYWDSSMWTFNTQHEGIRQIQKYIKRDNEENEPFTDTIINIGQF